MLVVTVLFTGYSKMRYASKGRHDDRGFAIPLMLLLLAVLTAMLSSAFIRVSADRRMAVSSEASVASLALAQSGLHRYMSTVTSRPADGDSVRVNLTGGFAEVVARVVQQPIDTFANQTFIIRSTGYVIQPSQGAVPVARRTVASFAEWRPGSLRTLAAFTGSRIDTDSNDLDSLWVYGDDQCGAVPSIPGVRSQNGTSFSDFNPDGSPRGVVELGSQTQVAEATGIRWAEIIAGEFEPDFYSLAGMPPGDTTFQSYLIDAVAFDADNVKGSGLLIITGELETGDNPVSTFFEWDGVVLIGDVLDAEADDSTVIRGLLVTGLNRLLGQNPAKQDFRAEPTYVYYNSCNVHRALERYRGLVPLTNAWVDNWAMY